MSSDKIARKRLILSQHKKYISLYWFLKVGNVCRWEIRNKNFIKKSNATILYGIFYIILYNVCGFYVLYELWILEDYLFLSEITILLIFLILHNWLLIYLLVHSPEQQNNLLTTCIKIDVYLGVNETKYLRDVEFIVLHLLLLFAALTHIVVAVVLMVTYKGVSNSVFTLGFFYFSALFFEYYDFITMLHFYMFMTLRVRHLNVALLKLANLNKEHLFKNFIFDKFIWKRDFENCVTIHKKLEKKSIIDAFKMIFEVYMLAAESYAITTLLGISYAVVGAFVTVQNFIIFIKSTDEIDTIRLGAMPAYLVMCWFCFAYISSQTDLVSKEIQQTRLICVYAQLKPETTDKVLKLTKRLLRTLEATDLRVSVFGMFYLDTGLVLRTASSTFIYIIAQFQLAFPQPEKGQGDSAVKNGTKTVN